MPVVFGIVLVTAALIIMASIKILREYERAVLFTLGRFWGVKGPGVIIVVPLIQQYERVGLRTIVMDVPTQDIISRDNVSAKVNAVVYFRVVNPEHAVVNVEDFFEATGQLAQTTLRSVLGENDLDSILSQRDKINENIRTVLDEQTDRWGIKISHVEIKHVDLHESMARAMARQAEAERERRAKVILAEGELQASQKILEASQVLSTNPNGMQLRYLQTLAEIANDKSNTVVFPIPGNMIDSLMNLAGGRKPKNPLKTV